MTEKIQLEIVGTERNIPKKVRALGAAHAQAINAHTRASVKRRDSKLALIAQMKEDKVKRYRDTEVNPPIDIELSSEDKLTVKKYRPPEVELEDPKSKKKGDE